MPTVSGLSSQFARNTRHPKVSPEILDIPRFTDEAWFHLFQLHVQILAYIECNSHNIRVKNNSNAVHQNVIHISHTSTPVFSARP